MQHRATGESMLRGFTGCHEGLFSMLCIAWIMIALQMPVQCTDAVSGDGAQMSIDEVIMEAWQSHNRSGLMNSPSIVRIGLDMLFAADDWEDMTRNTGSISRRLRRKAMRNEALRWPNAEVPYTIEPNLFTHDHMQALHRAISDYHAHTCIRFRPALTNDIDKVHIMGGDSCSSYVGRHGGVQNLYLDTICRKKNVIIHELGHVIGLMHEHTRYDRDEYVIIRTENVAQGFTEDFKLMHETTIDTGNLPYDYLSIMHYGSKNHNGQTVIETKNGSYQNVIGKRETLSFGDVKLVNLVYKCSERNRCQKTVCPGEGFVGQDCRCWCPSASSHVAAEHCPGSQCGDHLNSSGIIRSLGFPKHPYPNNLNCILTLQAAPGNDAIILELRKFSTEFCCDHLKITDALGLQLSFSGLRDPENITIDSPATIVFASDNDVTSTGYEIAFSSILHSYFVIGSGCSGSFNGSGIIRSPGFPEHYPGNLTCSLELHAASHEEAILLQIRRFSTDKCCDHLKIRQNAGLQISLSGVQPQQVITLGSSATVSFETDVSDSRTIFEIAFSGVRHSSGVIDQSVITGRPTYGPGIFTSPGFPSPYPAGVNCNWTIAANQPKSSLQLRFSNLSTEDCCDYLAISDGSGFQYMFSGKRQSHQLRHLLLRSPVNIFFTTSKLSERSHTGFNIAINEVSEPAPGVCRSDNWTEWQGLCFRVLASSGGMPWRDARSQCRLLGGFLVEIGSVEEQRNVETYVLYQFPTLREAWIGLKRNKLENQWQWDTGRPLTYHNWARGQPQNAGNNEICAYVNFRGANLWSTAGCNMRKVALCTLKKN